MTVRAKFRVSEVLNMPVNRVGEYATSGNSKIKFAPVYKNVEGVKGNACTENEMFGKATPSGEIWMNIMNQAAVDYFTPGKSYYVDFTEAPD